ncbi:DNA-binding SARP family transcriptional activator [Streptomyces ambofaciens]
MRYEILGPLRVRNEDTYFTLQAQKVEIVLTVLLVRADHLVSPEQLMREIWGENLPRRAAAGLHVYVSRLRKFLKLPGASGDPVETRAPGYVLHKRDDQIDAQIFPELVDVGRSLLREQRTDEGRVLFQPGARTVARPDPRQQRRRNGRQGPDHRRLLDLAHRDPPGVPGDARRVPAPTRSAPPGGEHALLPHRREPHV